MNALQLLIDAYLAGDTLFRFVYKPQTEELFLEDELDEQDNGQFLYVPYKDARELYLEMADFVREQQPHIEAILYQALCSPSPIEKFEKQIQKLELGAIWQARKEAFAQRHIEQWLDEVGIQ